MTIIAFYYPDHVILFRTVYLYLFPARYVILLKKSIAVPTFCLINLNSRVSSSSQGAESSQDLRILLNDRIQPVGAGHRVRGQSFRHPAPRGCQVATLAATSGDEDSQR